jgi:hypothetical protein
VAEDPREDVYETLIDPGDPDSGVSTGDRMVNVDPEAIRSAKLDPYITPHPDDDSSDESPFPEVGHTGPVSGFDPETLVDPPEMVGGGLAGVTGISGEDSDMMTDGIDDDGVDAIDDA